MKACPSYAWFVGITVLAATGGLQAAPATVDESAIESARFLLTKAITVSNDRTYHEMLRSLRQLRDPALGPLFEHLAGSDRAVLQIHGILGLAELSPKKKADLKRIIAVTDPLAQAELISAALDDKLVDAADCAQLVASEGLDPSVRLLAANELVRQGKPVPTKLLDEAVRSDNIGRKYLAALLKLQSGDKQGDVLLRELNKLQDAKRDGVRQMVLDTASRYKFDQIGPWALEVASEPNLPLQLDSAALRTAMRFGAPGAEDLWQRQFQAATDAAVQARLALTAMTLSPWVRPQLFAVLKAHADPLIKQLGVTGEAIALKQNIARAVVGLVQLYHPVASRVAMAYANEEASPEDAKLILLSLILAFDKGPRELKARLLDDTVTASQLLYEKAPDDAVTLLQPILADEKTDEHMVHGILLGLARTQERGADRVLVGMRPFTNPHIANVAILLKAKSDQPMTQAELDELSLLVRGGGRLQEMLRVQAAWAYIKRMGRAQPVLTSVLKG